ncbi:MAG TPA: riboflavin synthase [Armatimonadota bacterium]|jgi:riboflavin synthase
MFTGIVTEVGQITGWRPGAGGAELAVRAAAVAPTAQLGDSVAISGICLTVEQIRGEQLTFHLGQETMGRTTARRWQVGAAVNLEPALAVGDRLGGHFVSGHVDTTGTVTSLRPAGDTVWLGVSFPPEGAPFLVEKGSVTVDGISLTVARLAAQELQVAVIPFTWEHTTLAGLHVGSEVNLEYDLLGKYLVRFLQLRENPAGGGLTEGFLAENGFA